MLFEIEKVNCICSNDTDIDWFNNIKHKANKCFVNFDIVNFYPSIKHDHLKDDIEFANNYINTHMQ